MFLIGIIVILYIIWNVGSILPGAAQYNCDFGSVTPEEFSEFYHEAKTSISSGKWEQLSFTSPMLQSDKTDPPRHKSPLLLKYLHEFTENKKSPDEVFARMHALMLAYGAFHSKTTEETRVSEVDLSPGNLIFRYTVSTWFIDGLAYIPMPIPSVVSIPIHFDAGHGNVVSVNSFQADVWKGRPWKDYRIRTCPLLPNRS